MDADAIAVVTGWVTCRLVDHDALLHCKRCGLDGHVATMPRGPFLVAVRSFIRWHSDCRADGPRPRRAHLSADYRVRM
jgi:hypothetical protein